MFKLAIVVSIALFGIVIGDSNLNGECSAGDRKIVQEQWSELWHDTDSSVIKAAFARAILMKVVEIHPETRSLFAQVDIDNPTGGKFTAHSLRILTAMDLIVNLLGNQEALDAALAHLSMQHQLRKNIKAEYFKTFGDVYINAATKLLDEFNVLAWKSCVKEVTVGFTQFLP